MAETFAVGLISGTSLDGIDAALVEIRGTPAQPALTTLATLCLPYPPELHLRAVRVAEGEPVPVAEVSRLHRDIGLAFAECALQVIDRAGLTTGQMAFIGSHGQTVHHQPPTNTTGHTLQLGDGAVIAEQTGVTTVSNFRNRDIAAGGQGAPLVPLVDYLLLRDPSHTRCIQNLGGIGNVTFLGAGESPEQVLAFDTGPANLLLDGVIRTVTGSAWDADGRTARQGKPCLPLLAQWLTDPYFVVKPPKSTGREYFGAERVRQLLTEGRELDLPDLLATLTELTARSIADAYRDFLPAYPEQVFLCGGGARNSFLVERLEHLLAPAQVQTTGVAGVDSDSKEAIAFAVLGWLRLQGQPGNLPSVTGASKSVLLGDIYYA
ncbi:MAG: anhydro-N-acetylmuramic acid kinase [Gemmatimonadaceae bacterium]|nr:anhydro-N-acetylmuramic acid kinase [Gloeobacterales cyanobacterium ES-bin-141]